MSHPVVISVTSLCGSDVDLSCPGCFRLTNDCGFHGTYALSLSCQCQIHLSSYEYHYYLSTFLYFVLAWAKHWPLPWADVWSDPKDLQVEGTGVSVNQPSSGWVRRRSFWGDGQRECRETHGGRRERGSVRWGSEVDKEKESVWLPSLWSAGTFMSDWRPGIQCKVPERTLRVVVQCWGCLESPLAVMGFRAVLLSFLLLSLSWSRGAVITGVSERILALLHTEVIFVTFDQIHWINRFLVEFLITLNFQLLPFLSNV